MGYHHIEVNNRNKTKLAEIMIDIRKLIGETHGNHRHAISVDMKVIYVVGGPWLIYKNDI